MIDRDHFVIVHDYCSGLIGKNYDACDHAVAVIIPSTKERDILPTDYSGPPSTPKNGAGGVLCPAGAIEKSVHRRFPATLPSLMRLCLVAVGSIPATPMTEEYNRLS
jgi:hypothetical protein